MIGLKLHLKAKNPSGGSPEPPEVSGGAPCQTDMDCIERVNCDKTELILIGNQRLLNKCSTTNMVLDGNLIQMSKYVKYLGGALDQNLNFTKHIRNTFAKAIVNFIKIRGIRRFLNCQACETLTLG